MQKVWLHDARRDAISGGLGFPFSSPMRRISSRARRHSTFRFSQLVYWISPFLRSNDFKPRDLFDFRNDIARDAPFSLLNDCDKQLYYLFLQILIKVNCYFIELQLLQFNLIFKKQEVI